MRKLLIALFGLALTQPALAQSVQQSGSVTPNTLTIWNSTGVVKGGVTANDSPLTGMSATANDTPAICVNSARSTAVGRNTLCLSASTTGPAKITLQNYGTATAQDLEFVINGSTIAIPTGGGATFPTLITPVTINDAICASNTSGVLKDCGVSIGAGIQYGVPYYSATGALTSSAAAATGQFLLGQSASAPLWTNLTGDVATVSPAGAVTLGKVNGVTFPSTFTAHGVLIGEGTSQFQSVTTASIGQCLLSQGTSSDPIWSSCAAGAGSAGGSNTQVQFNNATSLGGSVNLTWVSPALTIGVAGTTTGQLALAPAAGASGTVTVQNPSTTAAYNFNLPTGAGSLGQPLLSGGGGSTAMSFGTLGILGGGTNCSVASGTCLDNITGFASTGYVNRTGAGTYAFSVTIPAGNGGTGLASGTSGGILGFTGSTTIASSALLAANGLMIGGGAGATPTTLAACTNGQIPVGVSSAAPVCQSLSGDIGAITSGGAVTIANSAVTVAKMANAAAYTLLGNFTGSSAAPQASTIGSLTQKASPAAGDFVMIQDNDASGATKYATVASISAAGSVASIGGLTGAVGVSNGVTTSGSNIVFSGAYSGTVTLTSASASALTMGANGATNPVLKVDASTASIATGLQVKGAAAAGGLALSVISSGSNEPITLDGKGSGLTKIGTVSTGAVQLGVQSQKIAFGATSLCTISQFTGNADTSWCFGPSINASSVFYVYNGAGNAGVFLSNGGTSWTSSSDERLKTIIAPISGAVGKLGTLRTVDYRYKTDDAKKVRLGLLAQDVEKVYPECVNHDGPKLADGSPTLGLSYECLVPALISAIKELRSDIVQARRK